MVIVLGAGLAGLSSSFHLRHRCHVYEKNGHPGGHIYSRNVDGFTWDEGPHVSFTKYAYVRELFEKSVSGKFNEYPVFPTNYYKGSWVPHPAQSNLYAVPEPMRSRVLQSFLESRSASGEQPKQPRNYKEWLYLAFGKEFAEEFPARYTRKYWTTDPDQLTTDWVGERVFFPSIEDVKNGFAGPPEKSGHYITSVRYPESGGYFSFAKVFLDGLQVSYQKELTAIDFDKRKITFSDGSDVSYKKLINTIPLPELIGRSNAPDSVKEAAEALSCSELLVLNFVADHECPIKNQWLYVYDEEKYSSRINFTNLLASNNGLDGKCGIQVEVYYSKYRPFDGNTAEVVSRVKDELVEMGLVQKPANIIAHHTEYIRYANVIFDHPRRQALQTIFDYLGQKGLHREKDELEAMTDWTVKLEDKQQLGDLVLAGRFGQWKYYWTDDCVLRGKYISDNLGG